MNLFDLIAAFFRWIGRVCVNFWNLCLNSLRLSLRYWYVVWPFVILFCAAALFYSRPGNRIYKAEAIAYLNGPLTEDVKQAFKPLEYSYPLFPEQNLGQVLNLNADQVQTLRRFETFNVIDFLSDSTLDVVDYRRKHKMTDTLNMVMPNAICIRFRTKRPDNVPVVGQHIIDFLNSNPSLQAAYERKHATLERKAKFCHDQLEKLDSLTSAFYFEQGGAAQAQMKWGSGMVLGRREIKLINTEILDMYKMTDQVDRELSHCTAPVVIQQAFTINPKAVNGRIKCTILGLMIGYILGCLVALAIKRRKEIREWYKKE